MAAVFATQPPPPGKTRRPHRRVLLRRRAPTRRRLRGPIARMHPFFRNSYLWDDGSPPPPNELEMGDITLSMPPQTPLSRRLAPQTCPHRTTSSWSHYLAVSPLPGPATRAPAATCNYYFYIYTEHTIKQACLHLQTLPSRQPLTQLFFIVLFTNKRTKQQSKRRAAVEWVYVYCFTTTSM